MTNRPKGLTIVLEFAGWHVGWHFSRIHSYISIGWVSLHVYPFAYLEHVSEFTSSVNDLLSSIVKTQETDLW